MAVKLNLGAGTQTAPGWINYDRSRMALLARSPVTRRLLKGRTQWPENIRVHDLNRGVPHETGSVDTIYSSHMLEHFTREDAAKLLAECHRVLKPGGLLRLIVPDLKVIAAKYVEGDREFFRHEEGPLADVVSDGLYGGERRREPLASRTVKRLLRSDDGGHKWMYDEESLAAALEAAGFERIQRVERGGGSDAEAAALDIRGGYHLHMEAFKPQ